MSILEALIVMHLGRGVVRSTGVRAIDVLAATEFQAHSMQRGTTADAFSLDGCTMAGIDQLTRDRTIAERDPAP
ncbi:hypothetical protein EDF18_1516 [Frigoribacterium sp. PhB107]|nr:hypothetical protein EDF18_1516 [Frigoribacterium sp. PhB107]